ncbi:mannose-1-phosphate guanylyltransferase [Flavobacteriaceae bacterium Ap0902]|nr:mannose-1-phosphate guanylyltransferase [Flavobacteriaceae bacterium Ap0902]
MTNSNTYCVIMAGGTGTRFWPLSTIEHPKQFSDILGVGKTLIQQTYERLLMVTSADKIYIVTDRLYKDLVKEQISQIADDQIIVEPVGMNTAPCVLYSSLRIKNLEPNANIIFCPSDHLILEPEKFKKQVNLAIKSLQERDGVYTLGIKPTRPDTGYGYIQFVEEDMAIKRVKTFTEKPNLELAEQFLDSGDFLWNSGVFIWKVETLLDAFKQLLPDMYMALKGVEEKLGSEDELAAVSKIYPTLQRTSIDIGIIEKYKHVYVLPSSFGWSDLGTWSSLYENSRKDKDKNAVHGKMVKTYCSAGNMINVNVDKAVVIEGLNDYIVVDTQEALLICPLSSDQAVKKFVNDLKLTKGGDRFV